LVVVEVVLVTAQEQAEVQAAVADTETALASAAWEPQDKVIKVVVEINLTITEVAEVVEQVVLAEKAMTEKVEQLVTDYRALF
jgi:hypothetical protein